MAKIIRDNQDDLTSDGRTMHQHDVTDHHGSTKFRVKNIVWNILAILGILLVLRFFLLIFGAAAIGFASFIYSLANPFVIPITSSVGGIGSLLISTIVSIVVLSLVAWAVVALIDALWPKRECIGEECYR